MFLGSPTLPQPSKSTNDLDNSYESPSNDSPTNVPVSLRENESVLNPEEKELIDEIQLKSPISTEVTLSNIDRYTLFKNNIP